MREIKFRSWDNRSKTMDFPDSIANNIDGNKCQIEQYTGIKDWWEGDIAEFMGKRYIVVFQDGSFRFKTKSGSLFSMDGWSPEPTKIGNIHENKELLNGEAVE
jgi:YopX protein